MARRKRRITSLGGGSAGLSVGHYARAREWPFVIYERARQWGGNCVTHEWNGFRYDSGAHRVHGADQEVVREINRLMNGNLQVVRSPSFIQTEDARYAFPLDLRDILKNMPIRNLASGIRDLLWARCARNGGVRNFMDLAVRRYGAFFARKFLLDYTEKVWGRPCEQLDQQLAGKRLAGLRPGDLLSELVRKNGASRHMEGDFHYPGGGIGRLMDALAGTCGPENIRLGNAVTRILHDQRRILAIELNGGEQVEVEEVVSTLPMNRCLQMLDPALASKELAGCFHFRTLVLVALFLDKERVMDAASAYFSARDVRFTRACEPRNRCASMSPPGKTSLVVEIPCDRTDPVWMRPDTEIARYVIDTFCQWGWFREAELLGSSVHRMEEAYPVITVDSRRHIAEADQILRQITNLSILGRNGRFSYSSIQDQVHWAKAVVEKLDT